MIEEILYYLQFRQNCKNNKQLSQNEIYLIIYGNRYEAKHLSYLVQKRSTYFPVCTQRLEL